MGGGGGNYSGYTGSDQGNSGGGDKLNCNCETICIDTILNSPQEEVLATLNVGDILSVREQTGKLLAFKNEKIAGSLTPPEQAMIISCIAEGHDYIAQVTIKTGAACKVQIKPKAS